MTNFKRSALILGLLAICTLNPGPARADAGPPGQVTTIVKRAPASATLVAVAAGAVINSGTLTLDNTTECAVFADNSLGGATRVLNVNYLADDGTTIVFQATNTVAIAGRGVTILGRSVNAIAVPTGAVIVPIPPSKFMSFQLAAGGAAAGSLQWTCRAPLP